MEDGSTFEATANHKYLVNRDGREVWVRVDELKIDDDIVSIQ
jgi:intein/homing endonuclease